MIRNWPELETQQHDSRQIARFAIRPLPIGWWPFSRFSPIWELRFGRYRSSFIAPHFNCRRSLFFWCGAVAVNKVYLLLILLHINSTVVRPYLYGHSTCIRYCKGANLRSSVPQVQWSMKRIKRSKGPEPSWNSFNLRTKIVWLPDSRNCTEAQTRCLHAWSGEWVRQQQYYAICLIRGATTNDIVSILFVAENSQQLGRWLMSGKMECADWCLRSFFSLESCKLPAAYTDNMR